VTLIPRLGAAALLFALALPGQTLDQAEQKWKARDYFGANDVFKALVAKYPENPDYRVRWGRLMLDHGQPEDAADLFNEALEIKKDCAGAFMGLALVADENFGSSALELAQNALKFDPKLVEAQELLARLALEDNDNAKAASEAKKALALDAASVQGKAVLASMDLLADKKDSPWDPHDARGYETLGRFFVLNRRYDEGIEYYRKAIALDPRLLSARSQLGINLMRMGQEEEAFNQLETCANNGFKDKPTVNSLNLLEALKKFETITTPRLILKMDKKERDLLSPYFQAEVDRILASYEQKYKFKLEKPVQVEVYPNHPDFEVRALGMPGLGALGVTFGDTIVMDSPSGRTPGEFHWASTLWHEMSHVFTISMTNSHVPRWFTEGLAVHEETQVSPEWGDRLTPEVVVAIRDKKLLPIAELDRGFIHPQTPARIVVSYFQGGRICDYITSKYGWDTILAMLRDFGAGEDTPAVVRKELKLEPAEFDKQFFAWVEADTKVTVDNFESWTRRLKLVSEMSRAKDYDGVIKEGTAIRDLYADYVEPGSVYEFLASAYLAQEKKPEAIAELERYTHAGGRNPETLKRLADLLTDAGNEKEAAAVLERLNYIYPMDSDQHRKLGALWLDMGNAAGAIREFRAVVAHNPIDPADAYYQLARAYNATHQTDEARDALLRSLEAAPGYRPAQKLLLELSAAETSGAPPDLVKK
jgi:tetratricopeptide (TPR) repeat protein